MIRWCASKLILRRHVSQIRSDRKTERNIVSQLQRLRRTDSDIDRGSINYLQDFISMPKPAMTGSKADTAFELVNS